MYINPGCSLIAPAPAPKPAVPSSAHHFIISSVVIKRDFLFHHRLIIKIFHFHLDEPDWPIRARQTE